MHRREAGRWEITRVPAAIRDHDRLREVGAPIQGRYERVCFEKERIHQTPVAAWLCPGHPLLDATVDLVLAATAPCCNRAPAWVDETDDGEALRVLFYLEHAVQDGRLGRDGRQQVISRRLRFVQIDPTGHTAETGPAPYLDYRPLTGEERSRIGEALQTPWLAGNVEDRVLGHAVRQVVPAHVEEVRKRRLPEIDKVEQEVTKRLKAEVNFWDREAETLKEKEALRPAPPDSPPAPPPPGPTTLPNVSSGVALHWSGSATSAPCRPGCAAAP